jgi:iron-sulfur cluster insertion protein
MISVTPAAASELLAAMKDKGIPGYGVRVQVVGGGCEGFLYDLLFEDAPEAEDQVFESEGVKVFVDPRSHATLTGLRIDHAQTRYGPGFVFEHARAKSRCSCGSSFSL